MNDSPDRKVEIFTEALQFPIDERSAYLDRACGSDLELRRHVEALRQSHGEAGDFLDEFPRPTQRRQRISS